MELYRKVRPQTFGEVVGNEAVVKALQKYLRSDNLPHVLLFEGPYGCGKSTFAEILKNELVEDVTFGFIKRNTSSFRGIDSSRAIAEMARNKPLKGKNKIILLEECHNLGTGKEEKNLAQNALLDTLENCPEHTYFILCTTNASMMVPAILSRCTRFTVELLKEKQMKRVIINACKSEKIKVPKAVREHIIEVSQGHVRDALQLVSKISTLDDEEQMISIIEEARETEGHIKDLCYALLDKKGWKKVQPILKSLKDKQAEDIRRTVIGMMSSAILDGWGLGKDEDPRFIMAWFVNKTTYDAGFPIIVFWCHSICEGIEHPYS